MLPIFISRQALPILVHKSENTQSYCVIVPTYNNENTLKDVLTKVQEICADVIVVNDGSTDSTQDIIAGFSGLEVISYPKNVGKGNALKLGLRKALDLGFDYAVTIDSDGQHYPDDIPTLVECFQANPGKFVMGARNMEQAGIPSKSSYGNRISSFWFWAETGVKLSDTQTGFRAYPLAPLKGMKFVTKKFEFEIEIIVRLAWKNVKYEEVKVKVDYPEGRVTHFRPFKDFTRISILNTVLFILALAFYLPRLFLMNFSLKRMWAQLIEEFKKDLNDPHKLALAVATGLFFSIFPIWGFQMIAAFALASYLKLNRAIVLIVSNISLPPMLPFIIYGSFKFGALFVENPVNLVRLKEANSEIISQQVIQYAIGSSLLAVLAAISGYLLVRLGLLVTKTNKPK